MSKFLLPIIFFTHHGVQNVHSLEHRYPVETKALMRHAHTHSPKNLAKVKMKLALNCIYTLQIIDSVSLHKFVFIAEDFMLDLTVCVHMHQ